MLILDALIRYSAVALLVMLVVLIIRDAKNSMPARYAALLCVTAAALLLGTPHPDLALPWIPHVVVRFLDIPSVVLAWWFGRSLFEDDFHLAWFEWLVMATIAIPVLMFRLDELGMINPIPGWVIYFSAVTSSLMMLHLIYITLSGRNDDLVESRRRVRMHFLWALALSTVVMLIGERLFAATHTDAVNTARAAIILFLVFWGMLWMLKFQNNKLLFEAKPRIEKPPMTMVDPRDQSLHTALIEQMEVEQVYTQAGLSIKLLAERLGTPEHRLRALINQGMGHRNFSGFVNSYRIEAIKEAMRQPQNSRTPILTLAMNVGFNSLAPFNRAFSNLMGQTPTEYRANIHKKH